jgi:ADP-heptose:LPS heptosyltransferase
MSSTAINARCRHYLGSRPCVFNKLDGSECPSCGHASAFGERVLFIKLDAIGDVLRSASMLPALRARHDAAYVGWLTRPESVGLVGMLTGVDEVIALGEIGLARLMTGDWDHVYSLSNDMPSAALASLAARKRAPVGFHMVDGTLRASNAAAEHWLEMAAFDRLKRANTRSYQALMFDIVGGDGDFAPPALSVGPGLRAAAAARLAGLFGAGRAASAGPRPMVAINVGSGARWPKKMIDAAQIAACCALLRQRLDVGGAAEAAKTEAILALCAGDPAIRPVLTSASIPEFVAILTQADVLLCGDTLALHIATAIGLPTVAVFGPTSPERNGPWGPGPSRVLRDPASLTSYKRRDEEDPGLARITVDQVLAAADELRG